jgi:hypothetical protein
MDETTSTEGRFVIVEVDPSGTQQTNGTFRLQFEPTTTPLLVDYDEFHPRSPQPGRNVVFMDDHAGPFQLPPLN